MPIEEVKKRQHFINGTLVDFTGSHAKILTEDQQEILWPIQNLPEGAQKGKNLRLILCSSETDTEHQERIAKKILNELLNSN